jgi:hypothetical protein
MAQVKTIAIANDAGDDYIIINESDYNPDEHYLWDDEIGVPLLPTPKPQLPVDEEFSELDQSVLQARIDELVNEKTVPELKAIAKAMDISPLPRKQVALATAIAMKEQTDGRANPAIGADESE